jgi:hypothetical protein
VVSPFRSYFLHTPVHTSHQPFPKTSSYLVSTTVLNPNDPERTQSRETFFHCISKDLFVLLLGLCAERYVRSLHHVACWPRFGPFLVQLGQIYWRRPLGCQPHRKSRCSSACYYIYILFLNWAFFFFFPSFSRLLLSIIVPRLTYFPVLCQRLCCVLARCKRASRPTNQLTPH